MSVMYTVMPPEAIWDGESPPAPVLWRHRGRLVYVQLDGKGAARVVSLVSTDPMDFLDPGFLPGAEIRAEPATKQLDGT